MEQGFLNIPLRLNDLITQKDHKRINAKNSIHNMISLITTTAYGEVKSNPEFGCEIWEYDFETIFNTHQFKDDLTTSIKRSIIQNEKRLKNVSVILQVEQIVAKVKNRRVKTRIKMEVRGIIDKTDENYSHQELFYIGPLSYY